MKLLVLVLFLAQTSMANEEARIRSDESLSLRIKRAALAALQRHPDLVDLQSLIENNQYNRADSLLNPRRNAFSQIAVFDELSITDCVIILRLKLSSLSIYQSDAITSNSSGDLPEKIRNVTMVFERVIERINDRAEWGPVAVEVSKALAVFRRLGKMPVTKWILASEADRAEGMESSRGFTAAGVVTGNAALLQLGVLSAILSGPVHVQVPDPENGLVITEALAHADSRLRERLQVVAADLKMGRVGRGWARLHARCQNALTN